MSIAETIMGWIRAVLSLFTIHKWKTISYLFFTLIFAFVLFPYNDLSEVVSSKINQASGGAVSLQFENLGFQIFPNPALAIDSVQVQSAFLPTLEASRISVAPSIVSLLTLNPGFTAGIYDIWQGQVGLELKPGKTVPSNQDQGSNVKEQLIAIELDKIDVAKMNETFNWPLKLQGELSGETALKLDPTFSVQPEGDVNLTAKDLRFPSGNVKTPFGPLAITGISWGAIQLNGRISAGKFLIEKGDIGLPSDSLNAKVKGEVDVQFQSMGGRILPRAGAYRLNIELNVDGRLQKDSSISLITGFLSNYNTGSKERPSYKFSLSGQSLTSGLPPTIGPYSTR